MADRTKIEWSDASWNPTTGCDRVSPGCDHCYAMKLAPRLKAMGSPRYQRDGDPKTSGPGFGVSMHQDALDQPLRWTKPRRIFVNSMSDLFHDEISDDFIAQVFAVMALAGQHTFQILTKRHGRMRSLLTSGDFSEAVARAATRRITAKPITEAVEDRLEGWTVDVLHYDGDLWEPPWPLPNVWLGVSVENQQWAGIRVPALLDTPASVRFLSCEPLLGPVDLTAAPYRGLGGRPARRPRGPLLAGIDWVIVGGESGPAARPMHPDWARSLRDQCAAAGVAFHFKQWGEWAPHRLDGGEHVNSRLSKTRFQYQSVRFAADGTEYVGSQPDLYSYPGMASLLRVGKRGAGRVLDGRTWDEFPGVVSP